MKSVESKAAWAASGLLALSGSAGAAAPGDLLTGEERWGCEVLLCLSDPRGPEAQAECRPPVERLYRSLRSRHPHFPKCPQAGAGNYAERVSDPFDPCGPEGLEDAPAGYVAEGRSEGRGKWLLSSPPAWNGAGIGSGSQRTKACVAGREGIYRWSEDYGDSHEEKTAVVYRKVIWMREQPPRAIDLYLDGSLVRRLRY